MTQNDSLGNRECGILRISVHIPYISGQLGNRIGTIRISPSCLHVYWTASTVLTISSL